MTQNLIAGLYREFDAFKVKTGRMPTEDERRGIKDKFLLEYRMISAMERHNLPADCPHDEVMRYVEQDMRENDARVIKEREEEERLMRGINGDTADRAYNVFIATVPERYKSASIYDFNQGASVIDHILHGGSCLVTGTTGCGKTRMLYAVCKHMCRQFAPYETVMDTLPGLMARVRSDCGASDWITYAGERYGKNTKLLVIDEYDKCKGSDSDYEVLNHIVNERYNNMLQTVIAGNGGIDTAKDILGDAIVSRLTGRAEGGRHFRQTGDDRRR